MLIVVRAQLNSEWHSQPLFSWTGFTGSYTHMCRTRLWCAALVNGFRAVHWQETQGWLFFSGWFGSALVWVLSSSLSSHTYSLKLEAALIPLVVALPPQLCSLNFCICSGLETTCYPHVLCFVFSHRLLVLTTACTYWGLLAKASVLQGEKSCPMLSLTVFTESRWKVL